MAYWWVNHKSTARIEIRNGALWAPLESNDNKVLPGHRTLAQVEPDDVIVSYANGQAKYVGRAMDRASLCLIPKEYGETRWNRAGRIVPVRWHAAATPFSPKSHLAAIQPMLPTIYSPLQSNGNANITYLSAISDDLGRFVIEQMGWSEGALPSAAGGADSYDMAQQIEGDWLPEILADLGDTDRDIVAKARTKQGAYRDRLQKIEKFCRVTGVSEPNLLIASHAKPWSVCDNVERVSPFNGLLLAPQVDHLFDRGLMQFHDNGSWSYSPRLQPGTISKLGLPLDCTDPRPFKVEQRPFLSYHREYRFKPAPG